MPRALKNLDITLGLAVTPVQLFTATSSQGVAFHLLHALLHAKCGSRIQMRLVFEGERGLRGVGTVLRNPSGNVLMTIEGRLADNSNLSATLWPTH